MFTKIKATLAGPVLEVKQYQHAIEYGISKNITQTNCYGRKNSETKDSSRNISNFRTKRRIRQLVYANAYKYRDARGRAYQPIFATFTFKDSMPDPKSANPLFTAFLKRLNYQLTGSKKATLKYITIVEFQKDVDFYGNIKPNGGSVHYHTVFFNLPFITGDVQKFFRYIWSYGFSKVNGVNNLQHLANYIAKYLTKSDRDKRLDNKKYFFSSKGLYQPKEIYQRSAILKLLDTLPADIEKSEMEYKTYKGEKILYTRFKLPDGLII